MNQSIAVLFKIYTTNYHAGAPLVDVEKIAKQQHEQDSSSSQSDDNGSSPNSASGLPTGVYPGKRANATFVTLARNSDIWEIAKSIRHVEDRFNRKFNYDWVFLNDKPFDTQFKKVTTALTSGKAKYGLIPYEHWSFPDWIDQEKAKAVREDMVSFLPPLVFTQSSSVPLAFLKTCVFLGSVALADLDCFALQAQRKIIYGDSTTYRHMCRYESGFFFRHELLLDYEYYWRVEPSVELFCDVNYDVFRFMAENDKKYGFVLSLYEYVETIPTLWDSVKNFTKEHPEYIHKNNAMGFLSDDNGDTYNHCHYWSNFEVGNLDFWRSKEYMDFFEKLDKDGGFFYERWGDAPVHSIAASLLLDKSQIHFFEDIA